MQLIKSDNEIVYFLASFFFIEIIGQLAVRGLLLTFRFFGMPQLYIWFHSNQLWSKILFTLLLVVAVGISTWHIIAKRNKAAKHHKNDE